MRYANIEAINLLWILLGLTVFLFWVSVKRKEQLCSFAVSEVASQIFQTKNNKIKILKLTLRILVLFFLVFALTRPQWGFHWQQISRKGVDIFIAVDVSKSMLAEDIKPNRLERTKLAIKDIVTKLEGDRVGLIAFAGSAFIQCPLTVDYSGFLLGLESLNTDLIPRGGTSIGRAIDAALEGFKGGLKKYSVLIMITDGENHEGSPSKKIEELKKQGIKVYTIGIGTEEGELIPVVDENGSKRFLKDRQGNVVKTRLDDKLLKELALKTGGSYVHASPLNFGLELLYDKKISQLEEREIESKQAKRYEDRFQIFLLLAFVLLSVEMCLSTYKKEL